MNLSSKIKRSILSAKHYKLSKAFKIKTHLNYQELIKLHHLSKNKIYALEIGSYIGASAVAIASNLNYDGNLICIDTWNNDAMSEGKMNTKDEFIKNTNEFVDKIRMIQGYSYNVTTEVENITTKLDFLFIDGDHSYEGVKKDWDLYNKYLSKGSIVAFHDYGWAEGVKKLIEEEVIHRTTNSNNLPNLWWGTII